MSPAKKDALSSKSLIQKLDYLPGDRVVVYKAPEWLVIELIENSISPSESLPTAWFHGFFENVDELKKVLQYLNLDMIEKGLWFSWPKKAGGRSTDLTEDLLREHILPLGWVDTKVAAIDDVWSGLKFSKRKSK